MIGLAAVFALAAAVLLWLWFTHPDRERQPGRHRETDEQRWARWARERSAARADRGRWTLAAGWKAPAHEPPGLTATPSRYVRCLHPVSQWEQLPGLLVRCGLCHATIPPERLTPVEVQLEHWPRGRKA